MTEPLLLGTTLLAVALLVEWCVAGRDDAAVPKARTTAIGVAFALACLTRYEAWPVTAAALAGAVLARRQERQTVSAAIRDVAPIAIYPVVTIAAFFLFSRIVVGQWFASGFFVPENPALGRPGAAANQILTGVRSLGGTLTTVVGLVGLIGLLARGLLTDSGGVALIALAPAAAAAVPWIAFLQGHPHRVRYMVPLLAAQAIGVGAAAARWRQAAPVAAVVLMIVAGLEIAPMFGAAPMTAEAQWDLPNAAARRQVTACLESQYDGTTVMASMGSLGHYMQELARSGFRLRDFLHEGNGDIWLSAHRARPAVRRMGADRGIRGRRRRARIDRPREPAAARRVLAGVRRRRRRALPQRTEIRAQNLNVEREQVVEPAQVDLAPQEPLVIRKLSFRLLIPDFAADVP